MLQDFYFLSVTAVAGATGGQKFEELTAFAGRPRDQIKKGLATDNCNEERMRSPDTFSLNISFYLNFPSVAALCLA